MVTYLSIKCCVLLLEGSGHGFIARGSLRQPVQLLNKPTFVSRHFLTKRKKKIKHGFEI